MRHAGTLAERRAADRFTDHLLTQGIAASVVAEDGGFEVWVAEEDQLARARAELAEFLRQPEDPRYAEAEAAARTARQDAVRSEEAFRKNVVDVRGRWGAWNAGRRPLTLALIAACVVAALMSQLGAEPEPVIGALSIATYVAEDGMIRWAGLHQIRAGEVWRLVTPIFIHFGVLHLLFNMMWLYDLGGRVETRRGVWQLGALVLVLASASNLAQYWVSGPSFGGMSGVVYGLFGYVWMKSRYDPASGLTVNRNEITMMVAWFFVCMTGLVGPVANGAHAAGFGLGLLLGILPWLWKRRR